MTIEKMLVASTVNVSRGTATLLGEATADPGVLPYAVYDKGGYGWWVYVGGEDCGEPRPADLLELVEIAQREGCAWIMLDRDADPLDGVPCYDW